MEIPRQRIRIELDVASYGPITDVETDASPVFYRGADIQFELAVTRGEALQDLINLAEIGLQVHESATSTGAKLMEKEVSSGSFNFALTPEEWASGEAAQVIIPFSDEETGLDLGGSAYKTYWIVIFALTSTGEKFPLGAGKIVCMATNFDGGTAPPVPPESYYTAGEVDALLAVKQSLSAKNQPNGYAGLDANGLALVDSLPVPFDDGLFVSGGQTGKMVFGNVCNPGTLDFSLCWWGRISTSPDQIQGFITKAAAAVSGAVPNFALRWQPSANRFIYSLNDGTTFVERLVPVSFDPKGQYAFIALVVSRTNNSSRLYYNGILIHSYDISALTGALVNTTSLAIGSADRSATWASDHTVYKAQVYNLALSPAEVKALARDPNALVSWANLGTGDFAYKVGSAGTNDVRIDQTPSIDPVAEGIGNPPVSGLSVCKNVCEAGGSAYIFPSPVNLILSVPVYAGKARFRFFVYMPSSNVVIDGLRMAGTTAYAWSTPNQIFDNLPKDQWVEIITDEIVFNENRADWVLRTLTGSSLAGEATGDVFYITDWQYIGSIIDPDFGFGAGPFIRDLSRAKSHGLWIASDAINGKGIKRLKNKTEGYLEGVLEWESSSAAQWFLANASVLPPGAVIESIYTEVLSGSIELRIGGNTSNSRYLEGTVLSGFQRHVPASPIPNAPDDLRIRIEPQNGPHTAKVYFRFNYKIR